MAQGTTVASTSTPLGTIGAIGNDLHIDRRKYDRDHTAGVPARELIDHRMQLYSGRSAD